MAELTVTLTDEEAALLETLASKRGTTPEQWAGHAVARELSKEFRLQAARTAGVPLGDARQKARVRMSRQLALAQHIREHGYPETSEQKGALATQLGISERTLYRYLEIAAQTIELLRPARTAVDGHGTR
jgi:predicted transcriptional regulator YheO